MEYTYKISSYSPYDDEGPQGDPVMAATAPPPAMVTGFVGKGWQPRKVPLKGDTSPDENVEGYVVLRANTEEWPYAEIKKVSGRKKIKFIDGDAGGLAGIFGGKSKLGDSQMYFYKVVAYNWVDARSEETAPISVITKPVPIAPEEFKTTSNRPRQVPLVWRKHPNVGIKKYEIYRSDRAEGEFKKSLMWPLTKCTISTRN